MKLLGELAVWIEVYDDHLYNAGQSGNSYLTVKYENRLRAINDCIAYTTRVINTYNNLTLAGEHPRHVLDIVSDYLSEQYSEYNRLLFDKPNSYLTVCYENRLHAIQEIREWIKEQDK